MTAVLPISANHDVLGFYHKQKSEFHFQDKSDNEFLMFLLDTAVRVISIVQHLAPVIEAVSDASNDDESFVEESNTSKNMEYDDLDKMVEEVQQLTTTPPPTNSIPSLPNAKPPELNVTAPPQPVPQVSHNQPVPLPEATIGISSSSGAGTSSCGGDESSNVAASSASTTLPPISSLEPLSHPSPMNTDEQSQQDPNQQQGHKHSHRENVPELVTVKDEILEQSEPPVSEQTPILGQDTINQLMSSLSSTETCIPNLVTTAQPSSLSNSLSNNALSMLNLASTSNSINNLFGSKTSGSSSADNLAGPSRVDSSTLRSLSDIKGFPNLSDASGAAASATPSSSGNPSEGIKCAQCGEGMDSLQDLNFHFIVFHKDSWNCQRCNIMFKDRYSYRKHCEVFHQMTGHECLYCNKGFRNRFDLSRHTNTVHLKLKPYKCHYCDKKFGEKSNRMQHMRSVHAHVHVPAPEVKPAIGL